MATGLPRPNGHAPERIAFTFNTEQNTVGITSGTDGAKAAGAARSEIFDSLDLAKCTKAKLAEFGKIVEQKLNAAWAEAAELRRMNERQERLHREQEETMNRQSIRIAEQATTIDTLASQMTNHRAQRIAGIRY